MTPPRANSAAARDAAYALHPYTDLKTHLETGPLVISHGSGVRVWDDSGRGYIDSVAGLWCASLGFSNERLVQAAAKQMRTLPFYHSFAAKSHEPMIDLAEMLIQRAPVPMSKVFFANSGSEANDSAIKMVWYFNNALGRPKKKKCIGRIKGYHGITVAAGSLTGLAANHRSFDIPLPGFIHTMAPHHYHGAEPGESEEAFATRCADELEKLILVEDPDTVAAMWAEPVMGAGGVIVPPPTYFPRLREICDRHNVLLIADEVITGFGRTGRWFALGHWGVTPDIVSFAKGVTSGYLPLGGIILSTRVHRALEDAPMEERYMHAATYSGHPTCCAVGLANVGIIEREGLVERAAVVGRKLLAGLETLRALPSVGDVRGLGMLAAVELVSDQASRAPASGLGAKVVAAAAERGLILRQRAGAEGPPVSGDSLCLAPPLMTPEPVIERIVQIVGESIAAAAG